MHAEVSSQLHAYGLDTEGVIDFISKNTNIEKKMDIEDEESDQTHRFLKQKMLLKITLFD